MYIRNPDTNVWEEVFLPPTGDTYPIGMYGYFAGNNAPTNWLRCDGQEVSRTDYAELFNTIGTTYGSGDGATTFNLPNVNLENRTLVGSSGDGEFSLGNTGGEKEHTLIVKEMPKHTHTPDVSIHGNSDGYTSGPQWTEGVWTKSPSGINLKLNEVGGSEAHNNMQPFMASVCCIKAKQSVGIVGNVTTDIDDTNDNAVPNTKTVKNYVEEIYSTEEVKTNKVWIDGKPIYRKVINFGNLPNNSAKFVDHNISNIEYVTEISGIGMPPVSGGVTNFYNFPFAGTPLMFGGAIIAVRANLTQVAVATTADLSTHTAYCIIEYTKTTD